MAAARHCRAMRCGDMTETPTLPHKVGLPVRSVNAARKHTASAKLRGLWFYYDQKAENCKRIVAIYPSLPGVIPNAACDSSQRS